MKQGQRSDFYVDVEKAYGHPHLLNYISDMLWEQLDKRTTCIAAEGYGGLSPASVVAAKYNLNLTLIRGEPKDHAKGGRIDGYLPGKGDKVSIIDDVFTTGGTIREIVEILRPTGAEILGSHVVVKRGEGELEIPVTHILVPEDLF